MHCLLYLYNVRSDSITLMIIPFLVLLVGVSAVNAEWVEEGIPICAESGWQMVPHIVSDGEAGAIITWWDDRSGDRAIYAQRINPYGRLLWDAAGVRLSAENNHQYSKYTISDGSGGALIAWEDSPHDSYTSIYIQRINGSGEVLWNRDGIAVCTIRASQFSPRMINDGASGAIVVWEDLRDGFRKVYAQRINLHGNRLWGFEGIEVSDALLRSDFFQILSDRAGGAIIVWVTEQSDRWKLNAQRINADGSLQWSDDAVVASGTKNIEGFSSTSDGLGGAIIAWDEVREDYPLNRLYAQRIDADGVVRWSAGGVPIYASDIHCNRLMIKPDGTGGVIMVWEVVSGNTYWQYAQRLDSNGATIWQENGVRVCYTASLQQHLRLISDGSGGAISLWSEERNPEHYDLIAQRIDGNGDFKWTITGLRVCSAGGNQICPVLIPDSSGGAIIAWQDGRNAVSGYDIYALRIGSDGNLPPVTKLQSYSARGVGYDIVVEWTLAQAGKDMSFSIFRSVEPEATFQEISNPEITNNGLSYTFLDRKREPSTTYRYRLDVSDDEGARTLFVTEPVTTPPMPVTLYQNFPNPFTRETTFYYYLPERGRVILEIYDVSGRRILRVLDGWRARGHHGEPWGGFDANGNPLPSGIYFFKIRTGVESRERKMILIR